MRTQRTSIVLFAAMCLVAAAGIALRPSSRVADGGERIVLDSLVPTAFGPWKELISPGVQVVNPQTQALIDKLYSQVLTRTYVDPSGYRIMLSVAYGDDQRGGLQAHRPEVCYPAQGFHLEATQDGALPTAFGDIEVRRLKTSLGPRNEPVTYWLTVGNQVIRNQLDKRIAQIRLGLTGQIPDGLLFRVSSIDDAAPHAFAMQQAFAAELVSAVSPLARKQLTGLGTAGSESAAAPKPAQP